MLYCMSDKTSSFLFAVAVTKLVLAAAQDTTQSKLIHACQWAHHHGATERAT